MGKKTKSRAWEQQQRILAYVVTGVLEWGQNKEAVQLKRVEIKDKIYLINPKEIRKRGKREQRIDEINSRMADLNSIISKIILNINNLNNLKD